jgi:hypothetical protein
MEYPRILQGKRGVVVGRTGSGKTQWARWELIRSPGSWLILDMKNDDGFNDCLILTELPSIEKIIKTFKKLKEDKQTPWIVLRPKIVNDPGLIDNWIWYIHEGMTNVNLYVDELYYIHENGRAGSGLTGWLTRGRSRKQSFLGGTQRPRWVSNFVFSESDYFSIFDLNLLQDRKRIHEFIGRDEVLTNPGQYKWRWFDISKNKLLTFGPVPA